VGDASALMQKLCAARGMADTSHSLLSYALLFPQIHPFIERISQAIERRERVCIFGDYDCDGITSTVQFVRFFARHSLDVRTRLPHRLHEGYGLKMQHIEECIQAGTDLLITVDTGIASAPEVAKARAAGIDIIILDHHHVGAELPNANVILHPLLAETFPEPYPSAAGVVYLALLAYESAMGKNPTEETATDTMLATIGTVADLVPLLGVNRLIVQEGLRACGVVQHNLQSPLALLFQQAGIEGSCTSRDLAFRIAPRLNAAGRMADPRIALDALLGDVHALSKLDVLNRDRQQVVRGYMEDLLPTIETELTPMLFAVSPHYSPGTVGLIAGKLTEQFGRPSFVGSIQNGLCTASLRSIPGFHVTEALARCEDLLLRYGGHAQAAGCHLQAEHLPALKERLCADVLTYMTEETLVPSLSFDAALQPRDIHPRLIDMIETLEPFGQGNPEPRFLLPSATLTDVRAVGSEGTHLQGRIHGHKLIGFGLGHLTSHTTEPLDIACRLGRETFRGQTYLQLYVDDVRVPVAQTAFVC